VGSGAPSEETKPADGAVQRAWYARALRRLATVPGAVGGALFAALIAWVVPTYAPKLFSHVHQGPPIEATLLSNPALIDSFGDDGQAALIPAGRKLVGTPGQGCTNFHDWQHGLGGIDIQTTRFRLILRGNREGGVLVQAMRARVLSRGAPARGTPVACPPAGAAAVRAVEIDLDSRNPLGHYVTLAGNRPLSFSLKQNEREVFDVTAFTKRCFCRWRLDVVAIVGDHEETMTIGDGARPFQTTAPRGSQVYDWDYENRWHGPDANSPLKTGELRPLWQ
jgi:hypothetical protein